MKNYNYKKLEKLIGNRLIKHWYYSIRTYFYPFFRRLLNVYKWQPRAVVLNPIKVIWFPIPKNASSSVKFLISSMSNVRSYNISKLRTKNVKYNNYVKYAILRDPWERLLSCYKSKIKNPEISNWYFDKGIPKDFYNWDGRFYGGMKFKDFIKTVCEIPDQLSDPHFATQTSLISDMKDNLLVNKLILIEDINKEIANIFDICGLDVPWIHRNILNGTDHGVENEGELREMVKKRYEKDYTLIADLKKRGR